MRIASDRLTRGMRILNNHIRSALKDTRLSLEQQRSPAVSTAAAAAAALRRRVYIDEDLIETAEKKERERERKKERSAVPLSAELILRLPFAEERDSSLSRI